jgi:choline-sulfatase
MRTARLLPLLAAACVTTPSVVSRVPSAHAAEPSTPPSVVTVPTAAASPTPKAPAAPAVPSQPPAANENLNVILVSVDALRADMPWAGYPRDIAPNLTALEKESVSYTRAYSISSYTAMSIGGLLAGRYPSELQRSGYFFSGYPEEETFFPELLQQAGVKTLAAHAHFYFDKRSGFRQGFDDYRMVAGIGEDRTTAKEITSPQHLALALEQLGNQAHTASPFFAWYHFLDPHEVYQKHEGIHFGSKMRDRYDGEVFYTDQHLGKLFEFVRSQPWGKRTAIIITADHGEAFGEHKMVLHGFELWDMLTHVPMFLKIPGVAPRRIDTPRSAIDLAPTIFELMGLAVPPTFQGKSLVAEMRGKVAPESRDVILDLPRTSDNFRRRALISDRYKLLSYDDDYRFELYDLIDDPGEKRDLRKERRDVFEQMKARYLERIKSIHEVCPKMRDKLKGKRKEKPC